MYYLVPPLKKKTLSLKSLYIIQNHSVHICLYIKYIFTLYTWAHNTVWEPLSQTKAWNEKSVDQSLDIQINPSLRELPNPQRKVENE